MDGQPLFDIYHSGQACHSSPSGKPELVLPHSPLPPVPHDSISLKQGPGDLRTLQTKKKGT